MNVGCWNVQGLSNKTDTIPLELEKYNLDIIALSETKKKGCGEEVLGNYLHLWSDVDKWSRARAGASILIQRKWKSKTRNWRFMGERILIVELVTFGREVVVIGAYAPTNDTASVGKDKFWDTLRDTLEEIPRRKEIIIMGI
jgi:exonuclease III